MDPATGMLIAQLLIKYGPGIAQEVAVIFSKPTHTLDDWNSVFAKAKTYEQMDAESKARVGAVVAAG